MGFGAHSESSHKGAWPTGGPSDTWHRRPRDLWGLTRFQSGRMGHGADVTGSEALRGVKSSHPATKFAWDGRDVAHELRRDLLGACRRTAEVLSVVFTSPILAARTSQGLVPLHMSLPYQTTYHTVGETSHLPGVSLLLSHLFSHLHLSLFSPSPFVVSSLLLSLRFQLWSFLSLFCVVAAAAVAVARFGAVFRNFRSCSLSLRPLLSSCQVHSSARCVVL